MLIRNFKSLSRNIAHFLLYSFFDHCLLATIIRLKEFASFMECNRLLEYDYQKIQSY